MYLAPNSVASCGLVLLKTYGDHGHPKKLCFCGKDGDYGRIYIHVPNELQIREAELEAGSVYRPPILKVDQVGAKVTCSTGPG